MQEEVLKELPVNADANVRSEEIVDTIVQRAVQPASKVSLRN